MFSRILSQRVYLAARGVVGIASPQVVVVCRGYRNRVLNHSVDSSVGVGESVEMSPAELAGDESVGSEPVDVTALEESTKAANDDPVAATTDSIEEGVDDSESVNVNEEELAALEKETDHLFRLDDSEEEEESRPHLKAEKVTKRNFEDEFFRLTDTMNHRYIEDDVNVLPRLDSKSANNEPVTFVEGEDVKTFFDKILALDENEITTEDENKRMSIVREEQKEETKEVKRNTWFNFMPAKERPEGFMNTYTPDQIFTSLEFDLLSRNMMEVYKYEKDQLLLTEVRLIRVYEL